MVKENQTLLNRLNGVTDGLMLILSMMLAYFIRFYFFHGEPGHLGLSFYVCAILIALPLFLLLYGLFGLYESFRSKNFISEFSLLLRANFLGAGVLMAAFFILNKMHPSRWVLIVFFVISTVSVTAKRWLMRRMLRFYRKKGYNLKHVLLVGSGELAQGYLDALAQNRDLGFEVNGYIARHDKLSGLPYRGGYEALPSTLTRLKPDEVVVALEADDYPYLAKIISSCEKDGVKVSLIPFYTKFMPAHPVIDEIGGVSLVNLRHIPLDNIGNAFLKRTVDIVGSLVLIVLTSPLMLIAAIGVKLTSPGPIIFKQERVGRGKEPFQMYKFRSMRVNAKQTTGWSRDVDPRKTKFGAFLRKFSIDELPQFFNVLKGDMSLIGPRPELPYFVNQFKESVPLYMVKHQVRPGITGWAQVNGYRGDTSIQARIEHDIYYIENWSLLFDVKILLMTLSRVVNSEKL